MKSLSLSQAGSFEHLSVAKDLAKPTPADDEVLVKVKAAAVNPVDWKMAKMGFLIQKYPTGLGCDAAGVVEDVGKNVTRFKKGDEVFGFTLLGQPGASAFAEYCRLKQAFAGKKPAHFSPEESSTLGVAALTAVLGLFAPGSMQLELPSKNKKFGEPEYLLVWGGASSVGQLVVQFGALAGYTVIATSSSHNEQLVKSLGATHVVDYKRADAVDTIRSLTNNKLKYSYDCISSQTADLCIKSLSTSEKAFVATISGKPTSVPSNVTHINVFLGGAAQSADVEKYLQSFLENEFQTLLDNKKIKANPVEIVPNGLAGIQGAFTASAEGKVSGKKLVAVIAQTP